MGEIRFDVASGIARCDTCASKNFHDPGECPSYLTVIYALTIGAGYRQPSYLCPDCLNRLRNVLGVEIGATVPGPCPECGEGLGHNSYTEGGSLDV